MNIIFWDTLSTKERIMGIVILILSIVMIYLLFVLNHKSNTTDIPESFESEQETPSEKVKNDIENQPKMTAFLMVDVKGAVVSPGVYKMENGKRVDDVLKVAGGLIEKADANAINLAQLLQDEMVIYVPEEGEQAPMVSSASEGSGKIDINKADANELQSIPGIGPSKAEAIISYREENGPFSTVDDLTNVPGIGDKTLDQMSDQITASN